METEKKDTFLVSDALINALRDKITLLNKRAKKLGCSPVDVKIDRENPVLIERKVGERKEVYTFFNVTAIGDSPKFEGWEWLATIMSDPVTETVTLRSSEFAEYERKDVEGFLETPRNCDHCKRNAVRKNTYIVRKTDTGELKQVGSACVRDFTGHLRPHDIAKYYQMMSDFMDEMRGGWGDPDSDEFEDMERSNDPRYQHYYFDEVIDSIAEATQRFGYVPSKSEVGEPTKFTAIHLMFDPKLRDKKNRSDLIAKSVEWAKKTSEERAASSEYFMNLKSILRGTEKSNLIEARNVGYVAPIVKMYLQSEADAQKAANASNEYAGAVKEKLDFVGEVTKIYFGDGFAVYTISDEKGRTIKWLTGKELEKDTKYRFVGRIKSLGEYRGVKETVISRAKFEKIS